LACQRQEEKTENKSNGNGICFLTAPGTVLVNPGDIWQNGLLNYSRRNYTTEMEMEHRIRMQRHYRNLFLNRIRFSGHKIFKIKNLGELFFNF
jgi:hypothetical protein